MSGRGERCEPAVRSIVLFGGTLAVTREDGAVR